MLEAINQFSAWKTGKDKTISGYVRHIRWFCLYLGNPDISQITEPHVTFYLNSMKALGWEENGVFPIAIALRQFFDYLDLHNASPFKPQLIQIPRKVYNLPRIVNYDDAQKLLDLVPSNQNPVCLARNRAIISLIWHTGLRVNELAMLDVTDLDFAKKQMTVRTEKSRSSLPFRVAAWPEETNRYLEAWLERRDEMRQRVEFEEPDALFVSIMNQEEGRRLKKHGIQLMLGRYCKQAGVDRINPHAFRHAKGRDIIEKGGDVSDVANILGHSNFNSSRPYLVLAGDRLAERARQFLTV